MNKKILSIFALIMALSFAVSCSNENTTGTGDGTGTGGGNPVVVSLKTASDATTSSTLSSEYASSAFPDVTVSVTGTDAAKITKTSSQKEDKVLVEVANVVGVNLAGKVDLSQASGIDKDAVTIKSVTPASGSDGSIVLTPVVAKLAASGGTGNLIDSDSEGTNNEGLIKVTLKFTDKNAVKDAITLDVYIKIKNTEA